MAEYVRVCVLENTFEAQLVASILDERDIPYRIHSYYDTAYDGLYQFQKGWGELNAPETEKQQILAILESVRKAAAGA